MNAYGSSRQRQRGHEPAHYTQRKNHPFIDREEYYPDYYYNEFVHHNDNIPPRQNWQTQMYNTSIDNYPPSSSNTRRLYRSKSQANLREKATRYSGEYEKSVTDHYSHNRELKDMMVYTLYEIADMLNDIVIPDAPPKLAPSKSDSTSSYKHGYRQREHNHDKRRSFHPNDYYAYRQDHYYPDTDRYYHHHMQGKKSVQFDLPPNYPSTYYYA